MSKIRHKGLKKMGKGVKSLARGIEFLTDQKPLGVGKGQGLAKTVLETKDAGEVPTDLPMKRFDRRRPLINRLSTAGGGSSDIKPFSHGYMNGGHVRKKHSDEAEDQKMIKAMVKPEALKKVDK